MSDPRSQRVMALRYVWGLAGLTALLVRAVATIAPEAAEALASASGAPEWLLIATTTTAMIWFEGYRGFQRGLVPRLLERARAIAVGGSRTDQALAPLVALDLVRATRSRMARRWALVGGLTLLIIGTRAMNEPWRGALLCGVLAGLSWGLLTLLVQGWRQAPRKR